jgi:hypothetical protein
VEKFPNQPEFLLISEFGALSSGKVAVIPNIRDAFEGKAQFSDLKSKVLSSSFKWPNSISVIPQDVFPGINAIVVPDGFLPPGKTDGNIYVLKTDLQSQEVLYQISPHKSGFFYHTGVWVDIDGDGRKDYLTARSNAQAGQGELVWYRHPTDGLLTTPWPETVITKGPDVMFDLANVQGHDTSFIVFGAEFFNHKLSVYQIGKGDGKLMMSRVIDDSIDQVYSVKYMDIDNDGKYELLVNNHETDNSKAAIFLYDVP